MEKVRIGIIGLGNMGLNHLRVYLNNPSVLIVAICDVDENNLERASSFCKNAATYTSYKEMLEKEHFNGVSIVVPTAFHKDVAIAAAHHKIPLLLEKPMAQNTQEAMQILEVLKNSNTPCLLGHIERFNPSVTLLKKKLDEKTLGKIYSIFINRIGPFPIQSVSTDIIKELAIHDLDVLRYLFPCSPARIYALQQNNITTPHSDILSCLIQLEDGIIASINVNWVSPTKKRELFITGEKGILHLDYIKQELYHYKQPTQKYPYTDDIMFKRLEGEVVKFEIDKKEPLVLEIQHFIDMIINNVQPFVSAEDGLIVLTLAQKISSIAHGESSTL